MAKNQNNNVAPATQKTDPGAKKDALATALAQIEKQFGKGAVMKLGDNASMQVDAISTGSIGLDLALGVGGVPYTVACKTGTAQVVTIAQDDKYDAKKLAKKHHDHALFIAFAPARNPRIALAVLVENGGFGAQAAAPVARQLIDYWLTGANSLELPPPKGVPLITQRRNR